MFALTWSCSRIVVASSGRTSGFSTTKSATICPRSSSGSPITAHSPRLHAQRRHHFGRLQHRRPRGGGGAPRGRKATAPPRAALCGRAIPERRSNSRSHRTEMAIGSIRSDEKAVADLVDHDGQYEQHPKQDHLHVRADLHKVHAILDEYDEEGAEPPLSREPRQSYPS